MKISVITVCFNSVGTLGDALKSVAAQTHHEIEHFVVDGASTDGTLEIIDRYGKHVAMLISEPNQGLYEAMNKGLL